MATTLVCQESAITEDFCFLPLSYKFFGWELVFGG